MSKQPSNFEHNQPLLLELCDKEGYPIEQLSRYHYRILGGTHIIDIWPSRMVYHRLSGETIKAVEQFYRGELDFEFNEEQVSNLLAIGEFK